MLDLPDEDINVGGGGGTSDIYIDLPPNTNTASASGSPGGRGDGNGGLSGNNATTGEGSGSDVVVVPEIPLLDVQDSNEGTDGNVNEPPRTDGEGIINGSSSITNGSAGSSQWNSAQANVYAAIG